MQNREDIKVEQAIVHILDSSFSMPVLSDLCLELNSEVKEFIQGHIFRILSSDDCKQCAFSNTTSSVYQELVNMSGENFIQSTKKLSEAMYQIMMKNVEIPSADVLFVLFKINNNMSLAVLKMNYKQSYIHFVEKEEAGTINKIIKQRTILPSDTQKLEEAIVLDFKDMALKLIEKKYEINGKKAFYLSGLFLECSWEFSAKTKISMVNRTVEQLNKKYFEDDLEKKVEFKKAMYEQYVDEGEININKVADKIFDKEVEIQQEFKEKVNQYGLLEDSVRLQSQQVVKRFEKQLIKTDSGIEINIPIEQYKNSDILEFVNNPDGTISIWIKNISKLVGG